MLINKVAAKVGLSPEKVQEVADCLIDEMGWAEIEDYNAEWRRGQQYDDAGGYTMRCIGRLIGGRHKYDELTRYKKSVRAMIKNEKN